MRRAAFPVQPATDTIIIPKSLQEELKSAFL